MCFASQSTHMGPTCVYHLRSSYQANVWLLSVIPICTYIVICQETGFGIILDSHGWVHETAPVNPLFWNLSSSLFYSTAATDTLDSAHNTPSATSHNTDTTTEGISMSSALTPDRQFPSATSTPLANPQRSVELTPSPIGSRPSCCKTPHHTCKDELLVIIANCNSIKGKKAALEHILGSMDLDILIAVETKTSGSIYDNEFLPQNQNSLKMAHCDYLHSLFEDCSDGYNKCLWRYLKGMRKDTCGVGPSLQMGV